MPKRRKNRRKKHQQKRKRKASPKDPAPLPQSPKSAAIGQPESPSALPALPTADSVSTNETVKQKTQFSWVLILTWVLGAFSIVNLINEFDLVNLKGTIGKWVLGYHNLVVGIVDFFLGWIPWQWPIVDAIESHLLLLNLLIIRTSSYCRHRANHEFYTLTLRYTKLSIIFNAFKSSVYVFALAILFAILFQGFISGFLISLLSSWVFTFPPDFSNRSFFTIYSFDFWRGMDKMRIDEKLVDKRYKALVRSSCIGTAVAVALIVCLNELL